MPVTVIALVNSESLFVSVKTESRGKAIEGLCPLLAGSPLTTKNSLTLHNQLGEKAPLVGISEVTDVGHTFSMVSVRYLHSTFLSTMMEISL